VHRDIKPANLFTCRYGRDADFVKVLDFGLTRAVAGPHDATLTTRGTRMGTPGYMSPEQVYGLGSDQRTDLYALGCVGYWLLAGEKPFESENAGELLRQHAQAIPPPLSSKARQAVPARIEAVVMACLSKDPDQRPQSADQLSEALEAAVDGNVWSAGEADRWWGENLNMPG
jgi:serine/threonine-protein kinase